MVKLKDGNLVWIDLNPLINLRVLGKWVDYIKHFDLKEANTIPFYSSMIIYENFFHEKKFSKKIAEKRGNLLLSPILHLWSKRTYDFMEVVGKEKVKAEELILSDLRVFPHELMDRTDLDDNKFLGVFDNRDYYIQSGRNGLPYKNIGKFNFEKCKHLDFTQTMGSCYYIRARVFLEYLKIFEPENLNLDYFLDRLQLDKSLNSPENQTFIFNQYSKMSKLNYIDAEFRFKVLN